MLEIWNGVHGSKGFAGATTGRTEGPLPSLSISAHSCPVEHLIWELFSVIYSQINFFFVCPFLHHFHKLQSKCCNFPLVLGYWKERMGKWPYAQLEIQRNATAAGDSEWGAGNWSDASEREGTRCPLVTAVQQPRGNAEASQVEQAAGGTKTCFHLCFWRVWMRPSGVAVTDVHSKHCVNTQKIRMTGRCHPLKDGICQSGPGAGGQLQTIGFAPWWVSSVHSQEVHWGLAAIWSWWIVAESELELEPWHWAEVTLDCGSSTKRDKITGSFESVIAWLLYIEKKKKKM